MVLLDSVVMKDLVRALGWTPTLNVGSDYPLWGSKNEGEEKAGISQHLLTRAATEALSLKWIVEEGIRGFVDGTRGVQNEE